MAQPQSTSNALQLLLFAAQKRCTRCGETKPLEQFYVNPMGRYRKTSRCRVCIAEIDREKRALRRALQPAYMPPLEKPCTRCHIAQPLAAFSRARRARDGRQSVCRTCCKAQAQVRERIYPSTLLSAQALAARPGNRRYTPCVCAGCGVTFWARGWGKGRRHCSYRCAHPQRHDDAFFMTWSDDFAWLLGLLWSDGCLSKHVDQVSLCSADRDLLLTAAHLAGPANVVLADRRGRKFLLHFYGRTVCDRLRVIGLTPAKSLTIGWPIIPAEHEAAFVRGVLDGDGTVRVGKARLSPYPCLRVSVVTGSALFRDALVAWLQSRSLGCSIGRKSANCWVVEVCAQDSLTRLHALLYPTPDVPCLRRKREPFDAWMVTPRAHGQRPCDKR